MTFKAQLSTELTKFNDSPKKYIQSDAYWAEQKIDGQRLLLRVLTGGVVTAYNRQGDQMGIKNTRLSETFAAGFNGEWWFDGEYMDDHYYIFDVLTIKGVPWHDKPYCERRAMLEKLFLLIDSDVVSLIPVARTETEKAELFQYTRLHNYEGLMFKPVKDSYRQADQNAWRKCKHYNTADAVLVELNRGGKEQAVTLGMYDNGELVEVGGLKVPVYHLKDAKVGDVIEVRYLHATPENKLYIPTFLRFRVDKPASECYTDQLIQTTKRVIKDYA